jgi:hypothetical protein
LALAGGALAAVAAALTLSGRNATAADRACRLAYGAARSWADTARVDTMPLARNEFRASRNRTLHCRTLRGVAE